MRKLMSVIETISSQNRIEGVASGFKSIFNFSNARSCRLWYDVI